MAESTEKRELELVDKLDFRILDVANNESKLEALLARFLAPLVLKAGSEHAAVRNKVVAVLKRVVTFVQPPGVVLPVAVLIDQFKSNSSPVVKQFDLVFIHHSLPRMDIDDKRDLFAKVTRDLAHGDPHAQGASDAGLFDVFLRLLTVAEIPPRGSKDDLALRETLGMSDADAAFLSRWLGKVLLLRSAGADATAQELRDANAGGAFTESELDFLVPAHKQVSPALLMIGELKVRAAGFLSSGAFKDGERFIPALHAASATDSRVSEVGDELLKRSTVNLEDPELVRSLFDAHSKLGPRYRTRILGLLGKSSVSTTMTKEIFEATSRDFGAPGGQDGQTISGYPNMFHIFGAHGPTLLSNGPTCVEIQGRWVADCIDKMERGGIKYINPKTEASRKWKEHVVELNDRTLLPTTRSTYMGGSVPGKVYEPVCYAGGVPGYAVEIREALDTMEGFEVVGA